MKPLFFYNIGKKEGWLNDAAAFWQRQIDKQKSN